MRHEHIVTVNPELCIRCGLCRKDCPHGLFMITETSAEIMSQDCLKCGHCVAICPKNTITMTGYEDAPEELTEDKKPEAETLMALIKGRRSTRQFTKQDISPEIVAQIIEAGRYTPTARNRQGVSYVVLRENKDSYEKTAVSLFRRVKPFVGMFMKHFRHIHIDDHFFFKGAPVVIVIKSDDMVDGALAASVMELDARAHGLGVLYSGLFTLAARVSPKLKQQLSAVSRGKIVTTLVLGYPAVKYHRTAPREQPIVQYD